MAVTIYFISVTSHNLIKHCMQHWIADTLQLNLTQKCCAGRGFLSVHGDAIPRRHRLKKVKLQAKLYQKRIQNFKLLQAVFSRMGVNKITLVDKLVKGKFGGNWICQIVPEAPKSIGCLQIFTTLSSPPNPTLQSHPQLWSRPPPVASLTSLPAPISSGSYRSSL